MSQILTTETEWGTGGGGRLGHHSALRSWAPRHRESPRALWRRVAALLAVLAAVSGCHRSRPVVLDLLPTTAPARLEVPFGKVPRDAVLSWSLELDRESEPANQAPEIPQIEFWLHAHGVSGHLLGRQQLGPGNGPFEGTLDLGRLAGRRALLQAVIRGVQTDRVEWRRAEVRSQVDVGWFESGPDPRTWLAQAPAQAPDIIVYLVDTLRADSLHSYGSTTPTPQLDRLAAEGVRFSNAWSTASWTRPATASLLTGLFPSTHGAEDRPQRLPESAFTLAERLRLQGYSAVGVVANGNVDSVWGFDQGFNVYIRPQVQDVDPEGRPRRHLHAEEVHSVALAEWQRLKSESSGPVFLYVHVVDPHGPYDPPEWLLKEERPNLESRNTNPILDELNSHRREATKELMSALRRLYAAEVAYSDRAFGRFFSALGPLDNTILVFTSDHGEAFQEHGFSSHGMSLYDEEINVPLIFWAPNRLPRGVVVHAPVSLVDVVPTLLHQIGGDPGAVPGVDLATVWRRADQESLSHRQVFSEIDYDGRLWRALHLDSMKLMLHQNSSDYFLFDLETDPGETRNIAGERTDSVDRLTRAMENLAAEAEERRLVDPEGSPEDLVPDEVLQNLRALGYVQ